MKCTQVYIHWIILLIPILRQPPPADKDDLIRQLHDQLSTSKEQLRLLESNSAQDAVNLRAEIELITHQTEAAQRKAELTQAETHSEARTIDQLRDDLRQLETNHASKKEAAEK
eukprot:235666_1